MVTLGSSENPQTQVSLLVLLTIRAIGAGRLRCMERLIAHGSTSVLSKQFDRVFGVLYLCRALICVLARSCSRQV